jgi:hypothetical protein
MCDGDVIGLDGVRPFDRMIGMSSESNVSFKATYNVFGANHNYYNTEWQQSETHNCRDHRAMFANGPGITGSAEQRQTGFRPITSFFRASVGSSAEASFNNLFNPEVTSTFANRVNRGYTPGIGSAHSRPLEDFVNAAGTGTFGHANTHSGVTVSHDYVPEHDSTLRGATIDVPGGGTPFFQTNFADSGTGLNLTAYQLLDFRIDLGNSSAATFPLALTVQLVNANNTLSTPVNVEEFVTVDGPWQGQWRFHAVMQTVRIPFSRFGSATLYAVRGVRFNFAGNSEPNTVYLANVRATRSSVIAGVSGFAAAAGPEASATQSTASASPPPSTSRIAPSSAVIPARRLSAGNAIGALRTTAGGRSVEIELTAGEPFRVGGDMLVLDAGHRASVLSRHPNGNLRRVIFTIEKSTFDSLADGASLEVRYRSGAGDSWHFGPLDKKRLTP